MVGSTRTEVASHDASCRHSFNARRKKKTKSCIIHTAKHGMESVPISDGHLPANCWTFICINRLLPYNVIAGQGALTRCGQWWQGLLLASLTLASWSLELPEHGVSAPNTSNRAGPPPFFLFPSTLAIAELADRALVAFLSRYPACFYILLCYCRATLFDLASDVASSRCASRVALRGAGRPPYASSPP